MKLAELAAGAVVSYLISKLFEKQQEPLPLVRAEAPLPPPPATAPRPLPPAAPRPAPPAPPPEKITWPSAKASTLETDYRKGFAPKVTAYAEPQTEAAAVAAREKKPGDRSYWMAKRSVTPEEGWKAKELLKEWGKGKVAFDGPRTFTGRRMYVATMHGKKKAIEVWQPKPPFV